MQLRPGHAVAGRDASPGDRPTDWPAIAREAKARIKRDRVTMAAGSLAYHWFLALFPAVIAALGMLSLVGVSSDVLRHLTDGIAKALPSGTASVFNGAVTAATKRANGSLVAVVIGVVVALWSASSGTAVLQQALDIAYEVENDKSYVARRVWAFPLMAFVAVVGGCAAALIVFGKPIGLGLQSDVHWSGAVFNALWTVVRWIVTVGLLGVMFSLVYYLGPNRKAPRWRWVTPGGVLATAVFLLASLAFSFYVSSFGSYSKTYGSFAGVAILIFWFWLVGLAVLVGGEVNAATERARAGGARSTGQQPREALERPRRAG